MLSTTSLTTPFKHNAQVQPRGAGLPPAREDDASA